MRTEFERLISVSARERRFEGQTAALGTELPVLDSRRQLNNAILDVYASALVKTR